MPAASNGFWVAMTMKGTGKREGLAVHAHLAFFHGLEKSRLRLRGRAVELVGQQHVGEDGPGPEHRLAPVAVEDHGARHVRREQVGRELHPAELEAQRPGQRLRKGRLADPREVLHEKVAAGDQACDGEADDVGLAVEDLADVLDNLVEHRRDLFEARFGARIIGRPLRSGVLAGGGVGRGS